MLVYSNRRAGETERFGNLTSKFNVKGAAMTTGNHQLRMTDALSRKDALQKCLIAALISVRCTMPGPIESGRAGTLRGESRETTTVHSLGMIKSHLIMEAK